MKIVRKFWWLLLMGLLLRLVIAAVTYHPDVKTPALSSAVVFNGSLNFYQDSSKFSQTEILDDLPISYLILLPGHALGRVLVSSNIENIFLNGADQLFGSVELMTYLIYLKLPFIIFDLFLGLVLVAVVTANYQKKILTLWMFNPVTLWATAAVGQFDIIPAFFIVLSILLIKNNKLGWAAFSLGLGASIKIAPFFLLPLLLWHAKHVKERVKLSFFALIPYALSLIPYVNISEFRQNALFAPQLSKSLFALLPVSGGESIILVPFIVILIYLFYISKKRSSGDFVKYSLVVLLSILSLTHFHMQWFLWIMPLLLISWIENFDSILKFSVVLLLISWVVLLFLFEASLQVKLFAPLIPALDQAKGLLEILPKDQVSLVRNLIASSFAAASFYIGIKTIKS